MKDIFDKCNLGDLKLNSRIIRTGTWETETEDGGFLKNSVYDKYEAIAGSGVGAIVSEIFALDHKDRFYPYSTNQNYRGFIKEYKMITDIVHKYLQTLCPCSPSTVTRFVCMQDPLLHGQ